MNFKKLMLSVGLSAMALLAMPGSTLTSPVSVQAATHEHILETYITKQPTCTATGTEIRMSGIYGSRSLWLYRLAVW